MAEVAIPIGKRRRGQDRDGQDVKAERTKSGSFADTKRTFGSNSGDADLTDCKPSKEGQFVFGRSCSSAKRILASLGQD